MKIKKLLLLLTLSLVIFISCSISVNADMGPKPAIYIDIVGIEGEYVAAFVAKEAPGPIIDYEFWLESNMENLEYNPIMEYKDNDGYKWISNYFECNGESQIKYTYYAPNEFKIVIYKNDQLYRVTDVIQMYAFRSYYKIDFSKEEVKINNTYPYFLEILQLLLRMIITLVIELGLYFLFKLHSKRNFKIVLIVNIVTQLLLNIIINISTYYEGELYALIILFLVELGIFIIEPILYLILLKDKNKWLVALYGILANIISFVLGFIFILILNI